MAKNNQKVEISEQRKRLYYGGMATSVIGLLMFMSNFVIIPFASMDPFDSGNVMGGFAFRGVGGFILIIAGQVIMSIGKVGAAGSGLILDPEQAREDLKPWSKMKGGVINDTVSEIDAVEALSRNFDRSKGSPEVIEVIKIKCRSCSALNEEDAVFCKACGGKI